MKNKNKQVNNEVVNNGLADLVTGTGNIFGSTQLSQTDTIFNNLRFYLISNMRQALSESYCEHAIVKGVVDIPVDDAFRGGVEIKTKQLSPEEIEQLQAIIEDEGVLETISQAVKWTRLYGGGGVVFMTNQKHDTKIIKEQNALKGMEIRAVDMWELFATQQNIDDDTRRLEIKADSDFCYNYYAINLHSSRVLPMKGIIAPAFVRPRLRGWGLSVIEDLVQSINQFFKTKNLTFEVLDEFKLDIFKIKGFNSALITKEGTTKMVQRVALANQQKNFQNAMTMDTEDDHISKQLNFAGISEIMRDIRVQLASDLRIPMTKLFGEASGGFSSGQDSIENYNAMVEGQVRNRAKKTIVEVIKMYSIREFGIEPSDLRVEFKPLRIMSSEQEENIKTSKLNRITTSLDKGICSHAEAKEATNQGNLLGVQVDLTGDTIEDVTTDKA